MSGLAPGQTLQPTALVHEAYLRLVGKEESNWENRRHFFFAASRSMRDILVEQARRKLGPRLGGDLNRQELGEFTAIIEPPSLEVLDLNESLDELEKLDSTKAEIVQLRYFGGLTMAEIAEVLGQSEIKIHRHWRFTRAWLKQRLGRI
jgi:RNA polymerase sigma factor (TIGR02999 family)